MVAIIGLDAAWTKHNPSGVALVAGRPGSWRCVAAAPSMAAFLAVERDNGVASFSNISATQISPRALLQHARVLAPGQDVTVVAIDMPLSTKPIVERREADRAVSREFGGRKCSTHSPTKDRPGPIATAIRRGFELEGFTLATKTEREPVRPALIEVYPHPALLTLLRRSERVPYKIARSARYWRMREPPPTLAERRDLIAQEWKNIVEGLARYLGPLPLPPVETVRAWKGYEDALDAIVCAWVGTRFVEGQTKPYGDSTAAIWCPV